MASSQARNLHGPNISSGEMVLWIMLSSFNKSPNHASVPQSFTNHARTLDVHVLGDEFFSYRIDPMLLQEIFQIITII